MCLMPYANNKGADQPAHPRSLINAFVVRCQDRMIPLVYISEISRLVSVAEQVSLCLAWSETPEDTFFHGVLSWIQTTYSLWFCSYSKYCLEDSSGDKGSQSDILMQFWAKRPAVYGIAKTCFLKHRVVHCS